ncbi:MAG TPA: hypothetical protein VGI34_02560, partial [Candidatus Acidoferrales bacterium]
MSTQSELPLLCTWTCPVWGSVRPTPQTLETPQGLMSIGAFIPDSILVTTARPKEGTIMNLNVCS